MRILTKKINSSATLGIRQDTNEVKGLPPEPILEYPPLQIANKTKRKIEVFFFLSQIRLNQLGNELNISQVVSVVIVTSATNKGRIKANILCQKNTRTNV